MDLCVSTGRYVALARRGEAAMLAESYTEDIRNKAPSRGRVSEAVKSHVPPVHTRLYIAIPVFSYIYIYS